MEKVLMLLRGVPGAGKTTLASFLQKAVWPRDCLSIATDDLFTDTDGNYRFDGARIGEAHAKCQDVVLEAMKAGYQLIIVHNTLTRESELRPYFDMAVAHGYRTVSLIVENRHGGSSVHGVPEKVLLSMRERFSVRL